MRNRPRFWICWLLLAGGTGWLAVSDQSLWIDEAHTAVKAMQPSWEGFALRMNAETGSDAQMPGYMALIWGWEKVFGHSEFALRALNIPLLMLAVGVVAAWGPGSRRFRVFWILYALSSPMLWFYLDEARPYTMQFAASVLVWTGLGGMMGMSSAEIRPLILFWFGLLLLCASSLTGVVFFFFFGLAAVWIYGPQFCSAEKKEKTKILGISCLFLLALMPLGFYYSQTLVKGARASAAAQTSLQSLAFSVYEFMGFLGVGPSRLQLRGDPVSALLLFKFPLLFFALVWMLFWGLGGWAVLRARPKFARGTVSVLLTCVLSVFCLTGVGVFGNFRLLGRHFMPVLPVVLAVLSWLAVLLADRKQLWVPVLLLAACLISGWRYRFEERHRKDDYRSAAYWTRNAVEAGWSVWWAADQAAAEYYRVPAGVPRLLNPAETELTARVEPDMILLSKPDIYDARGVLAAYLTDKDFQNILSVPAIHLWTTHPGLPSDL